MDKFGYVEQMPENVRDAFMWICRDLTSLQHKWDFYLELFGTSQNTDLLSELAPASFNIIYETLQNDITMAICRLSDPPTSKGQNNLSLQSLIKYYVKSEKLDNLLQDFLELCKPVRRRRNKRVSHRDLDTAIKPLENPLPNISKNQIDSILKSATKILNTIYQRYDNGELYFHKIAPGGAKSLVFWLKMGKEFKSHSKSFL